MDNYIIDGLYREEEWIAIHLAVFIVQFPRSIVEKEFPCTDDYIGHSI